MVELKKLVVSSSSVELAYSDSGVPPNGSYITIFALHGMCFSAPIFQKAQEAALGKGVRFVAINRRNYPGSTPFTSQELEVVNTGTPGQRAAWLTDRGHEIGTFIAKFIKENNLSPISSGGKSGGSILLGWSVGAGEANATIANADTLPEAERSILSAHLRSFILYEGAPIMYGLPMPEKNWAPFLVESIPPEDRLPAFGQWVTGYFDHKSVESRDLNDLTYVLVSTNRSGTIYNMSQAQIDETIFNGAEAAIEGPYMFTFQTQLQDVFKKALFDPSVRKLLPHLKVAAIAGTRTASFGIAGFWAVEKEAKSSDLPITFKMVDGINHFVHWDEPERAIDVLLELK